MLEPLGISLANRPKQAGFRKTSTMPTVVCILLASSAMPRALRRSLPLTVMSMLLLASPLLALDHHDPWIPPPHIRVESPELRALVGEAAQRSPVIRTQIDDVERSDITVYIRTRKFTENELDGRVGILSTIAGHRFLVVELACGRTDLVQMATLGHELQHVLEIVSEPSVVDAPSLAAYYERIGVRVGGPIGTKTFETAAAREAGTQVRRELLVKATRSTNGS
jgi:hypothetical protein